MRNNHLPWLEDVILDFYSHRLSNIDDIRNLSCFGSDPQGTEASDVIARGLGWIGPFHCGLDVPGMEVVIHHLMRRPCLHDLPLVQQNRAGTHPRDGRHVVGDKDHRPP
ncbi:MAG: hypothetical protein AABZ34_13120, partial [Nitrospirota bacterium]